MYWDKNYLGITPLMKEIPARILPEHVRYETGRKSPVIKWRSIPMMRNWSHRLRGRCIGKGRVLCRRMNLQFLH